MQAYALHQVRDVTSELSYSKSNHSFALFGIVDTHTTLQNEEKTLTDRQIVNMIVNTRL